MTPLAARMTSDASGIDNYTLTKIARVYNKRHVFQHSNIKIAFASVPLSATDAFDVPGIRYQSQFFQHQTLIIYIFYQPHLYAFVNQVL